LTDKNEVISCDVNLDVLFPRVGVMENPLGDTVGLNLNDF